METIENSTLFAYLNVDNPMVNWEVAIGRIRSSCDRKEPDGVVSYRHYDLIKSYAQQSLPRHFFDEYRLEAIREKYYPEQVSRLTGLYFFDTYELADIAIDRWNLPRKHKKHITKINFSATKITRVDSEWITNCIGKNLENNDWMHSYWKGETYGEKPLTEIIASGVGIVTDTNLIHSCFTKIMNLEPITAKLLAMAVSAFISGYEDIAQVIPVISNKGLQVKGNYYLDMRLFQADSKIDMKQCLKNAFDRGYRFGRLLGMETPELRLPDFGTSFEFNFKKNKEFSDEMKRQIEKI